MPAGRMYRYKPKKALSAPARKAVSKIVTKKISSVSETKFLDTRYLVFPDWAAQHANSFFRLSQVTQGTPDSSRIGDQIKPKSIRVRCCLTNIDGTGVPTCVRLVLFQWHPDQGRDPPGYDEILQSLALATIYSPLSEFNHDQRNQFSVLADRICTLGKLSTASGQKVVTLSSRKMRKLHYRGGSTNGNENIFLLAISDQDATIGVPPAVAVSSRLEYTDM